MRATGYVRKIDLLGRVVLPIGLRKETDIELGQPLEILIDGEQLILEKYKEKCIFCSRTEDIVRFKEKKVCNRCFIEILKL